MAPAPTAEQRVSAQRVNLGPGLRALAWALTCLGWISVTAQCARTEAPKREPAPVPAAAEDRWKTVATYEAKRLVEISGLAPSGYRPDVLWAHDDSGGDAVVHAINLEGRLLGSVRVSGVENEDWEDLAAFHHRGKPHLLIADTGDNRQERSSVSLHAVVEPRPVADGTYAGLEVAPVWTLTLRYEDGAQDCEAVAVAPQADRIFLVNKDGKASVVYEVPLFGEPNQGPLVARKSAVLPKVSSATRGVFAFFKANLLGTLATGMDISPDGRWAAVLTYTDIRLFPRTGQQTWAQALARRPMVVALPPIYQPEALCFGRDGRMLYVSSEGSPMPLVSYEMPVAEDSPSAWVR